MKVNLKYGYVIDVDTYNPYALQREDAKSQGKVLIKDRRYYYNLSALMNALRGSGKDYLQEYIEPLKELSKVQGKIIKVVTGYFDNVKNGLILDDKVIEVDLGLFMGNYSPSSRVISLDKKMFDKEGNPIYDLDIATMNEEPKLSLRKLGYCRWVSEFVTEFVLHSMLDKHDSEVVTMDKFVKYYQEELAVLRDNAKVTKVVVEVEEEDEDDLEVVED